MFSPFSSMKQLDRERFEKDMTKPAAAIRYVMHFTPRSGSSWVADLATNSQHLGRLTEAYNPNFLPNMSKAMNATNHQEYLDVIMRRFKRKNVFGFQITDHQLRKVFRSQEAFAERFPDSDWYSFWLVRGDIVAQAVSLYKMVQTSATHAPQMSAEEIRSSDAQFEYDGDEIQRWLNHILVAERGTEAFFAKFGITPLRMTYEHNRENPPRRIINLMRRYMSLPPVQEHPESGHKKISTSKNDNFSDQFRADFPDYLKEVQQEREPMLAKVEDYQSALKKPRADQKKRVRQNA